MNSRRRRFLYLAGAATLSTIPSVAGAQTYPTRTITAIVPFAAGGATDVATRVAGEDMSRSLRMCSTSA